MADLRMRLMGLPDEVEAVVAELRDEFDTGESTAVKSISPPLPCRSGGGRVRVYIVLDGTALARALRTTQPSTTREESDVHQD